MSGRGLAGSRRTRRAFLSARFGSGRCRRCLVLITAGCLWTAAAAAAAPVTGTGRGGKPLSLGRTTSIFARDPGKTTISLDEQWKIRYTARFKDIGLIGGGRLTGLLMIEQVRRNPTTLYLIRIRSCRERGCDAGRSSTSLFGRWKRELVLPKGRYSVYLISDGAPLQANLYRRSGQGRVVVTSLDPVPQQRLLRNPESFPGFYSSGHSFNLPDGGLGITATWPRSTQSSGGLSGTCLYRGHLGPSPFPYLPGCELRGAEVEELYIHRPGVREPTISLMELPEGRWNHGAYDFSPGGIGAGGLLFTMQF